MLLNPIQACFNYFKIIISVPIIETFFSGLLMFSFLFFPPKYHYAACQNNSSGQCFSNICSHLLSYKHIFSSVNISRAFK